MEVATRNQQGRIKKGYFVVGNQTWIFLSGSLAFRENAVFILTG